MQIYLLSIEQVGTVRYPKYFKWREFNPTGIKCLWNIMDYGFVNTCLMVAHDITQTDHDALILNADVFPFPPNIDQPVSNQSTIDILFEAANLPTNWMTPSTTYRELLRQVAGIMQFNIRYEEQARMDGVFLQSLFGNGITLESNWNNLSANQKKWFNDAVHSFGFPQNVIGNPKLRTLAKQAGDLLANKNFILGGVTF